MLADVEADQVVGEQSFEDLGAPRQDPKHLGIRPRDVPEHEHLEIRTPFLDRGGGERQMIVLDEHESRLVADLLERGLGESPVHLPVSLPVFESEARPHVGDVAQRPQRRVGEAGIVARVVLTRQPYPPQRVPRALRRAGHAPMGVRRGPVPAAVAVRHPDAAERLGHRVEGHGDAAGVAHPAQLLPLADVRVGLPIRHHHHRAVGKVGADPIDQLGTGSPRRTGAALLAANRGTTKCRSDSILKLHHVLPGTVGSAVRA